METMSRKDFLSMLGLGAGALAMNFCLGGCKTPDPVSAPTNVDFTLDLTNPSYSALTRNGGYVYNGGVIVARTVSGTYIAVSQACTHQGATVTYESSNNTFYCSAHGSVFSTSGAVNRGPAGSPLATYHTALNGTMLRVYS
jgi:cytochrome b6-f complex iron-sulfur subunit